MSKPNILIFMTDQQRGDTIFPYERAKTPHITAFCKEGLSFAQAHTVAPHCCPSRATFFSGLYPSQHGVWNNVNVGNTLSKGLYKGVHLFSEALREDGYRMYYGGKWHVSNLESQQDRGFDVARVPRPYERKDYEHEAPLQREWDKYEGYRVKDKREEGEIIRPGYGTYTHYGLDECPKNDKKVIDDAIDIILNRHTVDQEEYGETYIRNHGGKDFDQRPWCQMIAPNGPHDPYFVPQRFLDMYPIETIQLPKSYKDRMLDKPGLYRKTRDRFDQLSEREHKEAIRHYLALCSYEDDLFGQVLEALEASGEADNTLVLYVSDHGDYMAEHGLWCKGLPCFKGAYHIPAAMRWPKGIKNPGRIIHDYITLADFAPTFLDVCGIEPSMKMTGKSLLPYMQDQQPEHVQDALFTQSNGNELYGIQRSITTKAWKYVYNGFDYDELYNLEEDPHEMVNVLDAYQDSPILKALSSRLWSFARETGDVCINQYVMVSLAPFGPGVIYESSCDEEHPEKGMR
ncbi:sulfatase-like hydrolase/transferase [Vallitalea pronyensis]|uniref:Sulfatase-like hydrolase/transferase n=1 Tax=Vallitalea pronyensis TaxID=1348613 RepID=A0A8J8MIV3_9FIRM|nr:sulfatase-like hydrolase/transferase [Vallitalea pronyensis]QUI22252.1 sulfatase-like hydrolase/transferase [Vallitalea pronyensis]